MGWEDRDNVLAVQTYDEANETLRTFVQNPKWTDIDTAASFLYFGEQPHLRQHAINGRGPPQSPLCSVLPEEDWAGKS